MARKKRMKRQLCSKRLKMQRSKPVSSKANTAMVSATSKANVESATVSKLTGNGKTYSALAYAMHAKRKNPTSTLSSQKLKRAMTISSPIPN
jgi:hypothetical protein